jgi:hypothetical protein
MTFAGRLHSDLFSQSLDIPGGVPIEIKLQQNTDAKVLMGAANSTFALQLISSRLLIRSKRVSPSLALAHRRMLDSTSYRFNFTRVTMKRAVCATGSTDLQLNDFHTGPMPSRITICFVKSTALAGSFAENPFNFANFDLSQLSLRVGSRNVPHEPMQMNFDKDNYTRAYLNTLQALGLDQGKETFAITPEEWKQSFNVYVFKLTPGTISGDVIHPMNNESVSISVIGRFNTALAANVSVLAYIEQPSVLEIDKFNNVIVV